MEPRQHGATKYSLAKQLRLASDAILSFSTVPLRLGLLPGSLFVLVACAELVATIWRMLAGAPFAPGWTSLMIVVTLGFGCVLVLLSVIGIYVGKIFEQVKSRPVYLVEETARNADLVVAQADAAAIPAREEDARSHVCPVM
jgi:dolichol-phosphate mannosyltransferase